MRIFVVEVVLAHVDDRQFPQLRHVHRLVKHALTERAFAKETDRHPPVAEPLARKRRASRQRRAAADNRVRAEVARVLIGDVHRAAFAPAVAFFFAEQFAKHPVNRRAFGEAVSVSAMRAGDIVLTVQRFADANGNRFFADVQVRQSGHFRAHVKLVDVFLKRADREHLLVHLQPVFASRRSTCAKSFKRLHLFYARALRQHFEQHGEIFVLVAQRDCFGEHLVG